MRQSKRWGVVVFFRHHLLNPRCRHHKITGFGVRSSINTTMTTAMGLMNGQARARDHLLGWKSRGKGKAKGKAGGRDSGAILNEVWRAGEHSCRGTRGDQNVCILTENRHCLLRRAGLTKVQGVPPSGTTISPPRARGRAAPAAYGSSICRIETGKKRKEKKRKKKGNKLSIHYCHPCVHLGPSRVIAGNSILCKPLVETTM
jgi:hypothetical protein